MLYETIFGSLIGKIFLQPDKSPSGLKGL